ncbi:MAG: hypothetical protein WCP19_06595, partial [Chloroflexota bacterium]
LLSSVPFTKVPFIGNGWGGRVEVEIESGDVVSSGRMTWVCETSTTSADFAHELVISKQIIKVE